MNCAENNVGVVPCRCHCRGCGLLDTVGMSIGMCWLYFGCRVLGYCSQFARLVFPWAFSNVSTQASSASNAAAPPRQKNRGNDHASGEFVVGKGFLSMQILENVALIWNVFFFRIQENHSFNRQSPGFLANPRGCC